MTTLEFFVKRQVYSPPEQGLNYYSPTHEMKTNPGGKGRYYAFSWVDRDLILIMAGMHLPACQIAKVINVGVVTIHRFLYKYGIERDKLKVAKVTSEIKKSGTIEHLLAVNPSTYAEYTHCVRRLSKSVITRWIDYIDPDNRLGCAERHTLGGVYCVDHRLSVRDGFRQNVPLRVMCHPANMQVLTLSENVQKGSHSDISYLSLLREVSVFNRHCDPYTSFPIPNDDYLGKRTRGGYYQ